MDAGSSAVIYIEASHVADTVARNLIGAFDLEGPNAQQVSTLSPHSLRWEEAKTQVFEESPPNSMQSCTFILCPNETPVAGYC